MVYKIKKIPFNLMTIILSNVLNIERKLCISCCLIYVLTVSEFVTYFLFIYAITSNIFLNYYFIMPSPNTSVAAPSFRNNNNIIRKTWVFFFNRKKNCYTFCYYHYLYLFYFIFLFPASNWTKHKRQYTFTVNTKPTRFC